MSTRTLIIILAALLTLASATPAQAQGDDPDGTLGCVARIIDFESDAGDIFAAIMGVFGLVYKVVDYITCTVDTFLDGEDSVIGRFSDWFQNLAQQIDRGVQSVAGFFELAYGFIRPIWDFIVYLIEAANRLIELLGRMLNLFIVLVGLGLGWLFQVAQIVGGIFAQIQGAPVQPIAGLPRCISAPTESELCAIWYVLDWTLFAPQTPGEWLIPLLVLIVDLVILFYVAKFFVSEAKYISGLFRS